MRRLFRFLGARFFISMGLVSLVSSVLLLAIYLEIVPDRVSAIRLGRAALAESLAASTSALASQSDAARIKAMIGFVVERNKDLLSAAILKTDGTVVAEVGEHLKNWQDVPGSFSTDAQVVVPILAGQEQWGSLELRFMPLSAPGWRGVVLDARVELIAFIGVRISWLMLARKSLFARLAASASSFAARNSISFSCSSVTSSKLISTPPASFLSPASEQFTRNERRLPSLPSRDKRALRCEDRWRTTMAHGQSRGGRGVPS